VYYLFLGIIVGVFSAIQSVLKTERQPSAAAGLAASGDRSATVPAAALWFICRLERAPSLDDLLKALVARYEEIATAFSAGDITSQKALMSSDVYTVLADAIAARTATEEIGRFIGPRSAKVVDAAIADGMASLTIVFTGLVMAQGPDGRVLADTTGCTAEARDAWTFERPTGRHSPAWILVATEPLD
ncbi:MAG: TIM44-like domain-containing protein, partial [Devosia sp.]